MSGISLRNTSNARLDSTVNGEKGNSGFRGTFHVESAATWCEVKAVVVAEALCPPLEFIHDTPPIGLSTREFPVGVNPAGRTMFHKRSVPKRSPTYPGTHGGRVAGSRSTQDSVQRHAPRAARVQRAPGRPAGTIRVPVNRTISLRETGPRSVARFSCQKGEGSPEGRRSDCPPWDCRTERSERAEGPKVEQSAAARRPRAWANLVRRVAVVGTVVGGLLSVREIVYNSSRF